MTDDLTREYQALQLEMLAGINNWCSMMACGKDEEVAAAVGNATLQCWDLSKRLREDMAGIVKAPN